MSDCNRTNARLAFTLIEMVTSLVFLVTVIVGSLALLTKVKQTEHLTTDSIRRSQELRRLSRDLRANIDEATSIRSLENQSGFVIASVGAQTTWKSSDDGRWIQYLNSFGEENRKSHRDRYWIGDHAETEWLVDQDAGQIAIEIRHPARPIFRIECASQGFKRLNRESGQ